MFEGKTYVTGTKTTPTQQNSNARQNNKNNKQTAQTDSAKAKCAGGVCIVDWKPIPLFYGSSRS